MTGSFGSTRGSTEERILTKAAALFAQFGYNGVSTREIATSAEVNEVTIYRRYPRKRDLYAAVLSAELQRVHLRDPLTLTLTQVTPSPSSPHPHCAGLCTVLDIMSMFIEVMDMSHFISK